MKNNTLLCRKPFWTSGANIPGFVLVLAGTGVLLSPLFGVEASLKIWAVGIVALCIGVGILSTFSGVLIDFSEKRYKKFDQIAGWKLGEWEDLTPIQKVDIVQHEFRSTNIPDGIHPTLSGTVLVHKLVLISESKVVLELDYTSSAKATKAHQKVKEGLGLPS